MVHYFVALNLSQLQGIGDLPLAYQCFKLALAFNNDHAEAYNNLAVLELRKGRIEQVGHHKVNTSLGLLFIRMLFSSKKARLRSMLSKLFKNSIG